MKIKEFIAKYNLHDSFFKTISYDEQNHILFLEIEFAFWMQSDYVKDTAEVGILQVTFNDVVSYSCSDGNPLGDFSEILNVYIDEDGKCIISMMDDVENTYFEMFINAKYVSVKEIK